ncbi:MAG TPA: VPDSG-CTERM sorting domain-containing protein [Candidatus Acidoferrales bacterium]|nr:VPDSG-CTERM sorting domain-containing protein [Candidatus Acidoferrales bacterium]
MSVKLTVQGQNQSKTPHKTHWHHLCFREKLTIAKYKEIKQGVVSMKNNWVGMAAVAVIALGVGGIAQAVPIDGSITFAGGVTLNTSSSATATEVLNWSGPGGTGNPIVISDQGSFSGIAPGSTAKFASPWFFNSGSVSALFSVGGFTYNLTSSSVVFQGAGPNGLPGVLVDGIGSISGNGLDSEAMEWSFSTSDPSALGVDAAVFSFQVAAGTTGGTVPDGGTTAMLLGLGVLGLGVVKKQIFA